jgi:hypothetical protein
VVGCARTTALVAIGVALALPWSAWLGVATVPEAPTAALIAAGAIAVTAPSARLPASLALLAASLSRYEAWPVCAVFVSVCAFVARRDVEERARTVAAGLVALLGPILWMLWNAHAHGSPLHFLARVTAYRQAIGAAAIPLWAKLEAFPLALASTSPLVLTLAAAGALVLPFDEALRRRWTAPLVAAAAVLAFLVYGDARDGAPTHHPERSVLPILWILVPFATDASRTFGRKVAWGRPRREMWLFGLAVSGGVGWLALLPAELRDAPGMSPQEQRGAQIRRGRELPASGSVTITPCAYEHFALIAAAGSPQRFTIRPAEPTGITTACPHVDRIER